MLLKRSILFAPLGLFSLSILSGVFLMSSFVSADDSVVDNININVPISCSMEGTGMTSHNANIVNGTYQADIGTTTIKTYCNDSSGFAIYAIGYTDSEYGKTVLTNSMLGSTYDIATGTATSGNTSNWAMKLATNSSATYPITIDNSFDNYHVVPSQYAKVAHRDSGTDIGTNATGATLTSTYAVFMSQTQAAGTYTGQVKYTLVHPSSEAPLQPVACEAGKICYNANGSGVVGEMGKQTPTNSQLINGVVLWSSNFSRTSYGFAGWNDKFDYSGNFYGPQETITAPTDISTNGLSLYAIWVKSSGTIQNWNGCNTLAQGNVTALTDSRDDNTYAVAKLADGKCWMIENLRLDDTTLHNSDGTLAQGYNSSFIGLASPESIFDSSGAAISNSLYSTDGSTDATISGSYAGYRFPRYNNVNTESRQSSSDYSISGNTYSMGNYYTWHAAIADTTHYSNGNRNTTSICPTGWRIPTGTSSGEYYTLNTAINSGATGSTASNKLRSYPNNFLYSGAYGGSSAVGRSENGYYWSSTVESYNASNYLYLNRDSVYPGDGGSAKWVGRSVRCIIGS